MEEKELIKKYLMAILERAAGDTPSSVDIEVSPLIAQILLKII